MKRQLAILGSTGSIGTQALEVVHEHADLFDVYALTANNQVDKLIDQARQFMPEVVVIANEQKYPELKEALEGGCDCPGRTVGTDRYGADCHGRLCRIASNHSSYPG